MNIHSQQAAEYAARVSPETLVLWEEKNLESGQTIKGLLQQVTDMEKVYVSLIPQYRTLMRLCGFVTVVAGLYAVISVYFLRDLFTSKLLDMVLFFGSILILVLLFFVFGHLSQSFTQKQNDLRESLGSIDKTLGGFINDVYYGLLIYHHHDKIQLSADLMHKNAVNCARDYFQDKKVFGSRRFEDKESCSDDRLLDYAHTVECKRETLDQYCTGMFDRFGVKIDKKKAKADAFAEISSLPKS